jgi:SM-20-related protein
MLDLARLERQTLKTEPYEYAFADGVFSPDAAAALAATYPRDHFKTVRGDDG